MNALMNDTIENFLGGHQELEATTLIDDTVAKVVFIGQKHVLFCVLKQNFVPSEKFKKLFETLGDFVKKNKVTKFILDKRNLTVFDQPSMTWYHVEWKPEMKLYGLRSYRKILPDDLVFKTSVQIGRDRIAKDHHFNFNDYDISYKESFEEAFMA